MNAQHILIVEDEKKIADLLRDYLLNAGYTASCIERGDAALSTIRKKPPDLILLDIMLPGMEGTDVCREIRKSFDIPIIMITAKVEEIDRIIGLELGADDYICKPFSPREVVARVKAVLRRTAPKTEEKEIRIGRIHLDETKHIVSIDGNPLSLTPSEYGLLRILIRNPDRVFPRSDLINRVQGYDFEGYERTIDSHIKNLRKKLSEHLPEQPICSVYGVGYKFVVSEEE